MHTSFLRPNTKSDEQYRLRKFIEKNEREIMFLSSDDFASQAKLMFTFLLLQIQASLRI